MQSRDRGIKMGDDNTVDGMYVLEDYDLLGVLGVLVCLSFLTNRYIENPARDWLTKRFAPQVSSLN